MPRFSRLALICFATLGATGVYLAWRQSGALAALPATDFGKLLLIKSAIVLVIVALASVSRRAVGAHRRRRGATVAADGHAEACSGCGARGDRDAGQRGAGAGGYAPPVDVADRAPTRARPAAHGPGQAGRERRRHLPRGRTAGSSAPGGDRSPEPTGRRGSVRFRSSLAAAEPGHYVAPRMTSVPRPWTLGSRPDLGHRRGRVEVAVRSDEASALALVLARPFPAPAAAHVTVLPGARPGETAD